MLSRGDSKSRIAVRDAVLTIGNGKRTRTRGRGISGSATDAKSSIGLKRRSAIREPRLTVYRRVCSGPKVKSR